MRALAASGLLVEAVDVDVVVVEQDIARDVGTCESMAPTSSSHNSCCTWLEATLSDRELHISIRSTVDVAYFERVSGYEATYESNRCSRGRYR